MANVVLEAETRQSGSRAVRKLRNAGRVPGVVYGLDADPASISVDFSDLRSALTGDAGLNAVIELMVSGEQHLSIVKDLQRDPVRDEVLHVDFMRVDANQRVEVEVRIVLVGEAEKVTQEGGVVDQTLFTVLVSAPVTNIPNEIDLDISELEIGSSRSVADLSFPAGSEPINEPETSVLSALIPRSTIEAEAAEAAAEAEAAEEAGEGGDADADGDDADGGDDASDD
ncbi:MAG: 50S ribosomal protein L25 [Acidimicrobiales bacterium]